MKTLKLPNYSKPKPITLPLEYIIAVSDAIYKKYGYNNSIKNTSFLYNLLAYGKGIHSNESAIDLDNLCIDLEIGREIIDTCKEYLIFKMISDNLTGYEKSVVNVLTNNDTVTIQANSIISSMFGVFAAIPLTYKIIKANDKFDEMMESYKNKSNFFGILKKRYNLKLKLISKKYIKKKELWIIYAIDDDDNLFFFFHSKPDFKYEIGEYMKIRATVKSHQASTYTNCKETHLGRIIFS